MQIACSTCGRVRCGCADRSRRAANARYNAAVRASNARIDAGNRARTRAMTNVLMYAERGDERKCREWVVRLVVAGFDAKDGARLEVEPLSVVAETCRRTLGLQPKPEAARALSAGKGKGENA